jgi:hypothetical protein
MNQCLINEWMDGRPLLLPRYLHRHRHHPETEYHLPSQSLLLTGWTETKCYGLPTTGRQMHF